jgi:RNA polymerase primary sigma factor
MNSSKKDFYISIINYIENNLCITDNRDEALKKLSYLMIYKDEYINKSKIKIDFSIDSYIYLFKKSKILNNLIETYIGKNSINKSVIDEMNTNRDIIEMIDAYCIYNNIKEEDIVQSEVEDVLRYGTSIYLNQISVIPMLSEQESIELPVKIANGDVEAKKRFVEGNLRLVVYITAKQFGNGPLFDDMIQEGNIGLEKAVNKFDYTKGYKFSTYASWWIRHDISRFLANNSRTIRLPVYVGDIKAKLDKVKGKLSDSYGREATIEEVAKEMNMEVDEINKYYNLQDPVSIDEKIKKDGDTDTTYADLIASDNLSTEEEAIKLALRDEIKSLLSVLKDERQKMIFSLRYNDKKEYTLEECSAMIGVSRQRISQIEEDGLSRIRNSNLLKGYEHYFEDPMQALVALKKILDKEELSKRKRKEASKKRYMEKAIV